MYSDNLVIKLNTIAHQSADRIDRDLHAILSQPRYKNTGRGLASLHVEVIDGDRNNTPQIKITMDDHLILLDKRKMVWTKLPPIKPLMEWAETVEKNPKRAKALAWGTAIKQRKTNYWKPKVWRRRGLSKALKEMNEFIKQAYDTAIEEETVKEFEKGLKQLN